MKSVLAHETRNVRITEKREKFVFSAERTVWKLAQLTSIDYKLN